MKNYINIVVVFFSHRVLKNTGWLFFLQLINYAAPLIIIPFITKIFSPEEFGALMTSMSTLLIATVITDYGFNLAATHRIAKNTDNNTIVNDIISLIFTIKVALIFFGILFIIFVSNLDAYSKHQDIFYASIISLISQTYHSGWLFQGLQRMRTYSIYMACIKCLYVFFVILFSSNSSNIASVMWCWSIANLIGALIVVTEIKKLGYSYKKPNLKNTLIEIKYSSQFFYSRIAVSMYTSACTIVVGTIDINQAAIYSLAEKFYTACQAFTAAITQALFPYMANEKNWNIFYKIVGIGFIFIVAAGIFISLFAENLVTLLTNKNYASAATILSIMMVTLVVNYLSSTFGYPALTAIGKTSMANKSVIYGSMFFVISAALMHINNLISAPVVAFLVLITEVTVLAIRLNAVYSK